MFQVCYLEYSCSKSQFFYITVVFFSNFLQLFQVLLLKHSKVEYIHIRNAHRSNTSSTKYSMDIKLCIYEKKGSVSFTANFKN